MKNSNIVEINAAQKNYGKAKDENYNWWTMFANYVSFRAANGREPKSTVKGSKDCDESKLYTWVVNQRRLIKNGHMSEDHLAAFKGAGIIEAIPKTKKAAPVKEEASTATEKRKSYKKFEECLAEYKAFRDKYGFNPRCNSDDEAFLYHWFTRIQKTMDEGKLPQRKLDLLIASGILDPLPEKKITKPIIRKTTPVTVNVEDNVDVDTIKNLDDEALVVTRKKRESQEHVEHRSFEENLAAYLAFKKEHNRNPKSIGGPTEKRLYNWMYIQTRKIKDNTLSSERYELLKASGVDIPNRGNQSEKLFNDNIVMEKDYAQGAGAPITMRQANYLAKVEAAKRNFPAEKTPFYKWIQAQFKHYGVHLKDYQRQAWIDAGFEIKPLNGNNRERIPMTDNRMKKWINKYNSYVSFIEKNGRTPHPNRKNKEELRLYYWKFSEQNSYRCGSRTDEQIEYLKKIGIIEEEKAAA